MPQNKKTVLKWNKIDTSRPVTGAQGAKLSYKTFIHPWKNILDIV